MRRPQLIVIDDPVSEKKMTRKEFENLFKQYFDPSMFKEGEVLFGRMKVRNDHFIPDGNIC